MRECFRAKNAMVNGFAASLPQAKQGLYEREPSAGGWFEGQRPTW